jgi:hypothetical protein
VKMAILDAPDEVLPPFGDDHEYGARLVLRVSDQYECWRLSDFYTVPRIGAAPALPPGNRGFSLWPSNHQRPSVRPPRTSANRTGAFIQRRTESANPRSCGHSPQDYKRFCFARLRHIAVHRVIGVRLSSY